MNPTPPSPAATTTTAGTDVDRMFTVSGKVVLVTGGTRGIGRAIAEEFVRRGARVYITGRDSARSEVAAAELSEHGDCIALTADLTSVEACRALADQVASRESRLDVLVNNAGALWAAPLAEYPESGWDKVYDVNVKSVFFLIQALMPLIDAAASPAHPARIINVGSIQGFAIAPHETYAYSSSKAAVHHLSRTLAAQLAPKSITVNVLAPGIFPSRMVAGTVDRDGEEAVLARVPLGRLATAADLAGTAIYLASPAGAYLTGAMIPVDGGAGTLA